MLPGEPVALPAHGPHPLELVTPRLHIHHLGEAAVSRGIDDHVVAVPIENSPQSEPHEDARAEREEGSAHRPAHRVVVVRRIGWIGPGAIDHDGVVDRHVDDLGIDGHDLDDRLGGLLHDHGLLRRGGERSLSLGPRAQPLDGIHQVLLLAQEGVAELLRPVEPVVHHGEHLREKDERLHAVVPRLRPQRVIEGPALQARVGLDKARRLDHFERIGGGHQDLRQQGVGIEGDRGGDLLQLLGHEKRRRRGRRRRWDRYLSKQRCGHGHEKRQHTGQSLLPEPHRVSQPPVFVIDPRATCVNE